MSPPRAHSGHSTACLLLGGVALIVLLGLVDYLTRFEVSFAVFYLIPVCLLAWSVGKQSAAVASVASALTGVIANELPGGSFSHPAIAYWNIGSRLAFFLIVSLLLARLKDALKQERDLARTDHLTGAANARAFYEAADLEVSRARRHGHPLTVAYLDVDNFKAVNDRFGHSDGDALLRSVAACIRDSLRLTDSMARLGGDEFAILLPENAYEPAEQIVRRIRERLIEEAGKGQWPVTFSIGVLTYDEAPQSVEEMVRRADDVMYLVKNGGKNAIRHEVCPKLPPEGPASQRSECNRREWEMA